MSPIERIGTLTTGLLRYGQNSRQFFERPSLPQSLSEDITCSLSSFEKLSLVAEYTYSISYTGGGDWIILNDETISPAFKVLTTSMDCQLWAILHWQSLKIIWNLRLVLHSLYIVIYRPLAHDVKTAILGDNFKLSPFNRAKNQWKFYSL